MLILTRESELTRHLAILILGASLLWPSGPARAAEVGMPCGAAELAAVMPGGGAYDGQVSFNCPPPNNVISLDDYGSEFLINQDLDLDGSNVGGGGARIVIDGNGESVGFSRRNAPHRFLRVEQARVRLHEVEIMGFSANNGDGGIILNHGDLTLSNATITDADADGDGGGIASSGSLHITGDSVIGYNGGFEGGLRAGLNPATGRGGGGAIAILPADGNIAELHIDGAQFDQNKVETDAMLGGGAILLDNQGGEIQAYIANGRFTQNQDRSANGHGGGAILALKSGAPYNLTLEIEDTLFGQNSSPENVGGALANLGGFVRLKRSEISDNSARASGGLDNRTSPLGEGSGMSISDSTIAQNRDESGNAGIASVGGGEIPPTNLFLYNSTVARNVSTGLNGSAPARLGVNFAVDNNAYVVVGNSIIAEPRTIDADGFEIALPAGSDGANCGTSPAFVSPGSNLFSEAMNIDSDGSCIALDDDALDWLNGMATQAGLTPQLDANSGSTRSYALNPDSAALDTGNDQICSEADQRGVVRPQRGRDMVKCDIGAYEHIAPARCNDGLDNDGDGLSDLNDPGCTDAADDDEADPLPTPTPTSTPTPTPTPTSTPMPTPQPAACSDGRDNDRDGLTDLNDPGCSDGLDDDEFDPPPAAACADGQDNDGDGLTDNADPGCVDGNDNDEANPLTASACANGLDDDGDGLTDLADPGCSDAADEDESNSAASDPATGEQPTGTDAESASAGGGSGAMGWILVWGLLLLVRRRS